MIDFISKERLDRIKSMRLMDDALMCAAFKDDIPVVQEVLRIIMDNPSLVVKSVITQDTLPNLRGHSVRFDVSATDKTGKYYDIEVQRADKGADRRRARYNLGILDSNIFQANDEYCSLPEVWVIFITENDYLKKNLPIYHIERVIQETGDLFDDGEHIIYVNGANHSESDLGRLMDDFRATDPNKMHSKLLAKKVRMLKETEEGNRIMCVQLEEEYKRGHMKGIADGIEIGAFQKAVEVVQALNNSGMPLQEALRIAKITEESYISFLHKDS